MFMVELSPAGYFVPWRRIQPMRLDHPWDSPLRAGPWFDTFMGALLVYRLSRLRSGTRPRKASFSSWLLVELLVNGPIFGALIVRLVFWLNSSRDSFPPDTTEYVELAPAALLWQTMVTLDAFAILGCAVGAVAMFLRDDTHVTHPTAPALRRGLFPLLVLTLWVALFVAAYTIAGTQLCGVNQADLSSFAVGLATFARVLPSLARPSRTLGAWYDTMTGLLLLWSYLLFGFLLLVMSILILRAHVRSAIEERRRRKACSGAAMQWGRQGELPPDALPAEECEGPADEAGAGSSGDDSDGDGDASEGSSASEGSDDADAEEHPPAANGAPRAAPAARRRAEPVNGAAGGAPAPAAPK